MKQQVLPEIETLWVDQINNYFRYISERNTQKYTHKSTDASRCVHSGSPHYYSSKMLLIMNDHLISESENEVFYLHNMHLTKKTQQKVYHEPKGFFFLSVQFNKFLLLYIFFFYSVHPNHSLLYVHSFQFLPTLPTFPDPLFLHLPSEKKRPSRDTSWAQQHRIQ